MGQLIVAIVPAVQSLRLIACSAGSLLCTSVVLQLSTSHPHTVSLRATVLACMAAAVATAHTNRHTQS
jgi:hypothetical protein